MRKDIGVTQCWIRFLVLVWFHPGSPPRVREVSKATSGALGDHSLAGISALGIVCSLVLEMNVKVPLDGPNLILCS